LPGRRYWPVGSFALAIGLVDLTLGIGLAGMTAAAATESRAVARYSYAAIQATLTTRSGVLCAGVIIATSLLRYMGMQEPC
jgi:hypothetical protein